jgi:ppGpp synthetase/RelA/SpoT-type nucleotidyltranferase
MFVVDKAYLEELDLYDDFIKSGMPMPAMQSIIDDFSDHREDFEKTSLELASRISKFDSVYLTRSRVKTRDGLIEKLIRKTTKDRPITLGNYKTEITDLIGVRALHVFKSDFCSIHAQMTESFGKQFR